MTQSSEEIRELTAQQLVEEGLVDPVKTFIKNEPHNQQKIAQKRLRLICSVSTCDYIIERWLFKSINQKEISLWHKIPSKPGMGLDDGSLNILFMDVARRMLNNDIMSTDVSAWDYSVKEWEALLDAELMLRQRGTWNSQDPVEQMYNRAVINRTLCSLLPLHVLSDGSFWAQLVRAKQLSGRYTTSSGNSRIRGALAQHSDEIGFVIAMGDDCNEDAFDTDDPVATAYEYYRRLGHPVKDVRISQRVERIQDATFVFCSHLFKCVDNKVVAEPLNWGKMFYRLLNSKYSYELLVQFCREMRHSPHLKRCLSVLATVEWGPVNELVQTEQLGFGDLSVIVEKQAAMPKGVVPNKMVKGARKMVGKPKPNANSRARAEGGKYSLDRRVEGDMQKNSDAYLNSVFNPFGIRDCRVPEMSTFPSTVGSIVTKRSLAYVTDSGTPADGTARFGILLQPNLTYVTSEHPFESVLSGYSSTGGGAFAWTSTPHPNIDALATNFGLIRVVSMGLRMINTGVLIDRSGTLYANVNAFGDDCLGIGGTAGTSYDFIEEQLLSSPDTLMIDLAQIGEQGLEINWLPLSMTPTLSLFQGGADSAELTPAASEYVCPSVADVAGAHSQAVPRDTAIFLWGTTPAASVAGLNLEIEFIVNYEAIPFPGEQFLHELKSVAGSEDHIAVSYEKAGRQGAKTAVAGAVSNVNTLGPLPQGGVSKTLGGGNVASAAGSVMSEIGSMAQNMLRDLGGAPIVSQIMSAGKGLLGGSGAMGGVALADVKKHRLAVMLGVNHISPLLVKANRALDLDAFVDLATKERAALSAVNQAAFGASGQVVVEGKDDRALSVEVNAPQTPVGWVTVPLGNLASSASASVQPTTQCVKTVKSGAPLIKGVSLLGR